MKNIIFCTGNLNQSYEVIDIISASKSLKEKLFCSSTLDLEFERLKKDLAKRCIDLGGDAVINFKFKYDVKPINYGWGWGWHTRRLSTVFAYGTVVKFN